MTTSSSPALVSDKRTYFFLMKAISVNHLYATRVIPIKGAGLNRNSSRAWTSYRYPTDDCIYFKETITDTLDTQDKLRYGGKKFQSLGFVNFSLWVFLSEFWYKNGRLKEEDASNFIKAVEDAFSDYLGIGDEYNIDIDIHKRPTSEDAMVVQISAEGSLRSVDLAKIQNLVTSGSFSQQSLDRLYKQ